MPGSHTLYPNKTSYVVLQNGCDVTDLGPVRFVGTSCERCTYVWYKDAKPISTGNTLSVQNVQPRDSGIYYCLAYNAAGNLTSEYINVTVHGKLQFNTDLFKQS